MTSTKGFSAEWENRLSSVPFMAFMGASSTLSGEKRPESTMAWRRFSTFMAAEFELAVKKTPGLSCKKWRMRAVLPTLRLPYKTTIRSPFPAHSLSSLAFSSSRPMNIAPPQKSKSQTTKLQLSSFLKPTVHLVKKARLLLRHGSNVRPFLHCIGYPLYGSDLISASLGLPTQRHHWKCLKTTILPPLSSAP